LSHLASVLFGWVQNAEFYRGLHSQAVDLMPPGAGRTWLDVGCGPGLVTRLAAERGYRALGVDNDPDMIRASRRAGRRKGSTARFGVGDLTNLAQLESADVVSACSLLAVVDDRTDAIGRLLDCLRPTGTLLIVESTATMKPGAAREFIRRHRLGVHSSLALSRWARVRDGSAVDPTILRETGRPVDQALLLDGLVAAWRIQA
jgi:ubiquinone/menaquinone biosynthesis C-methylase UbiE